MITHPEKRRENLAEIANNRPLTPEILAAEGWEKSFQYTAGGDKMVKREKRINDNRITILYGSSGGLDIFNSRGTMCISVKQITVGEFNTLLEIVKLSKFQIK